MSHFKKFTLKTFTSRGFNLTPIEFKDLVPFAVKRMYYFFAVPPADSTGEHCHREEQEIFIVAKGSVKIIIDEGQGKEEYSLIAPGDAVYVSNYVWHGFKNASPDCLIIALSSTNYRSDRSDYLEDYSEYLKIRDTKLK